MKNKVLITALLIGSILIGYYAINIIFPTKEAMFQAVNLRTNLLALTVIGVPFVITLLSVIFKKSVFMLIATIVGYFILSISAVYYLNAMGIQLFNPLIYIIMLLLPIIIMIMSLIMNNKNMNNASLIFNILSFVFISSNISMLMTQNDSKLMLTQLTIKLIVAGLLLLISLISYFFNRLTSLISIIVSVVIFIIYLIASNAFNVVNQEMFYNIGLYIYPYLIYLSYIEQSNKNT